MRDVAWLVALTGCQIVFPYRGDDAGVVDADDATPTDTPAVVGCPVDGAPVFTRDKPFITGGVTDYSPSPASGRAIAMHNGNLVEGPIDSDALIAASIEKQLTFENSRLAPSGSELFVTARDEESGVATLLMYRKIVSDSWVRDVNFVGPPMVTSAADSLSMSAPTATPTRLAMVATSIDQVHQLVEYTEDTTGAWVPGESYDSLALGILSFTSPSLSEDGKRLVVAGNLMSTSPLRIYYSARGATTDRFPPMVEIVTPFPTPRHPYLTSQCERLYVVGNQSAVLLEP